MFALLTVSLAALGPLPSSGAAPSASERAPRPKVTKVAPKVGTVSGGQRVTIRGRGLAKARAVTFGGVRGTRLKVINGRRLTVVAPRHDPGRVSVRVRVGKHRSAKSQRARYRYRWVKPMLAGGSHSVALRRDGSVFSWGNNLYLQQSKPGANPSDDVYRPVRRSQLSGARSIAAGFGRTFVIRWNGTVMGVGNNMNHALGNPGIFQPGVARPVKKLRNARAVATGYGHTIALRKDGTVWGWGRNVHGQVGDGTYTERQVPVRVKGLSKVKAIAVGNSTSYALRKNGTIWAWGSGTFGSLGNGRYDLDNFRPRARRVAGLSKVTSFAAGSQHVVARRKNGTVWTWGGSLVLLSGDGSSQSAYAPQRVPSLTNVTAVSAGDNYSSVAKSDGSMWAWGGNYSGQLGIGVTSQAASPVRVAGSWTATKILGQGWYRNHMLAMEPNGRVRAWGWNMDGQLGLGSGVGNQFAPKRIPGLRLK